MTEIEEERRNGHGFGYMLESDFGDIYLLQTDPSGSVVYGKWFLFNKNECSENDLAEAMYLIKKFVPDPKSRKAIVLDAISACRPVMRKLKRTEIW